MTPLLDQNVIKELLTEAVGNVKSNKKAYILTCPRCEKKNKLYIRKVDGRFVCFYCKEKDNYQGAPEYCLTDITGRPVQELRRILYGNEGTTGSLHLDITFDDYLDETDTILVPDLPEVVPHPDFRDLDSVWAEPGIQYLESRGIPLAVAKKYDIQYWPAQSRVVFPVKSRGKLLGWQSRTIKPEQYLEDGEIVNVIKALTYEGLAKDRALMFADQITDKHVILCEGPIDAIKADLCGGNVATLGKAVSHHQLNLIVNSGVTKVYFGLDPDASEEVASLVSKLTQIDSDIELYDMRPKNSKDLGEMTFQEVYEQFKMAPRVTRANLFLFLKDFYGT